MSDLQRPSGDGLLTLSREDLAPKLFGDLDQNLKRIESALSVRILARGRQVRVEGEDEVSRQAAAEVLRRLEQRLSQGESVSEREVETEIRAVRSGQPADTGEGLLVTVRGKVIRPKTPGQSLYVDAIRNSSIVFGIGPAGTGKTYLAMAMALAALRARQVMRLVLCRPAVEAGEKLGFLPGDLQEKVDPYLRPLYDALFDMLGVEPFERLKERGIVEIAPLAYMRGRTLDDAFIILDEAQNTTPEQMKMFITRLGFGSRVVVTGDVTQIDLPKGQFSGLRQVERILKDVEGIGFVHLTEADVVRHELVARIIEAYEVFEQATAPSEG